MKLKNQIINAITSGPLSGLEGRLKPLLERVEILERIVDNLPAEKTVELLKGDLTISYRGDKITEAKIWSHELDADLDCTEIIRRDAKRWLDEVRNAEN